MIKTIKLLYESVLFALKALRVNKLRTTLSLLGVTIGIFIIISVFTAVDSLEKNLRSSVESLGDDIIYVQKWPWFAGGGEYKWWDYLRFPNPTYREYKQLLEKGTSAEAIGMNLFIGGKTVKFLNNSVSGVTVTAATHDYDKIRKMNFSQGRYFSSIESGTGSNVAIIGSTVAEGLFPSMDPVGRSVKMLGRKVTVIGVFEREGESMINNSTDNTVLVPFHFAKNIVARRGESARPTIIVKAGDQSDLTQVQYELQGAMRTIRRLKPSEPDNFSLNKTSIISNQMDSLFSFVNIIGIVIGGFSILVGGFGIANIMFVSVKERTSLIGIQKSLGAKNYFILSQFLSESIVLCLFGGAIGLLLVFIGTQIANLFMEDFTFVLSSGNIISGCLISIVIGVISGFMPANTAANLNPVDAIRSN
ncbi:MAG: putative ABC transport system permease protein [Sphingobacteriales bacterium]|jgi:putative ABC transport system permease protein